MHEVAIFRADLFKIWDTSSEENGRYEVAIFIKADLFQSLILKSHFTFGGQYSISKNTVGLSAFCIKPRSTPYIAGRLQGPNIITFIAQSVYLSCPAGLLHYVSLTIRLLQKCCMCMKSRNLHLNIPLTSGG